jgi:rubrerythrin
MGVIFDPTEIFQLAITIEENGEKFYRTMAERFKTSSMSQTFLFLAEEEVGHKKTYQEILSSLDQFQPHENYPGEYMEYLRNYAERIIFNKEKFQQEVEKITDIESALDFAIGRELDSILYYSEIKHVVLPARQKEIDAIIDEERNHFIKLSGLKKK